MVNKATREKCRGSDHEWLIKNVNLAFDGMQWKSRALNFLHGTSKNLEHNGKFLEYLFLVC